MSSSTVSSNTDITIAGAGIAGLVTALALAKSGRPTRIVEAFEEPGEIGAGIQLAPNATSILARLGVLEAVQARAIAPRSIRLGDAATNKIVLEMQITPEWLKRMDAPYLAVHRAALHTALYDAAVAEPNIELVTGHRIEGIEERDDAVRLKLATADGTRELQAGTLIGADGIWSKVRAAVPASGKPAPTGRVAWRAMGPAPAGYDASSVTAWMAPNAHVIVYPIRNTDTLNIVAVTSGTSREPRWDQPVVAKELRRLIEGGGKMLGVNISKATSWTLWPLFRVRPDATWHTGRIALIGDAAHGMEPFSAQGAAMAIEDGYALAACMARQPDDTTAAFAAYRALRLPRLERVAKRTDFNRWVYHQSGPGRWARNRYMAARGGPSFLESLEWLYGYRVPG
ncbi:FAD-dependent monooxygenase [Oricola sp.]|uniref:FAD-dependent monooxygenase n=1 Tax=Oricola sp. TaxID=1979950 RepID=UPI003BAB2A68